MQTFESVRQFHSPAHLHLIEALLDKGLTFAGSVESNGERITSIKSCSGDITLYTSGQVELFTENINPYEPYDCGYHAWNLSPDDIKDADMLSSTILRMTGDD